MKLLSIAVPCFNSQEYMRHCVDTLLSGGDEVEILIVNDGSKDDTAVIADEYAANYPGIVRAIHQENAGHGGAVMAGLQNATGLYFKVVDSDDWVDEEALGKILYTLRKFVTEQTMVDLLVSNFVYDKVGVRHKKVIRYGNALPENKILGWDDVGRLRKGQYLLMHSVIYKTQLLRESGMDLPRHTFYVDNLFVYVPMRCVETMYYLNVDLYHYFIGRNDQSVNESVMIRRIDQQIKVNKLMQQQVDLKSIKNKRLQQYLYNYFEIITVVSSILMIRSGTQENLEKKTELWNYLKEQDAWLYYRLRRGLMGQLMNADSAPGRALAIACYKISQKLFGFN
ncbi:MAG: glycosyltransferase family 2 protein [Candidatus Fournierella pullistercoris]|uniref:Glycosyltransferase family 2 protein n=1 Tax=Candidatus Allofournierella pullistercoris TaxID=2838597 RepID=A0A948T3D6_9FIRM|nr:glycosyltransferase family 2 protein [Candidatus Fournierella pullistercoris]